MEDLLENILKCFFFSQQHDWSKDITWTIHPVEILPTLQYVIEVYLATVNGMETENKATTKAQGWRKTGKPEELK